MATKEVINTFSIRPHKSGISFHTSSGKSMRDLSSKGSDLCEPFMRQNYAIRTNYLGAGHVKYSFISDDDDSSEIKKTLWNNLVIRFYYVLLFNLKLILSKTLNLPL